MQRHEHIRWLGLPTLRGIDSWLWTCRVKQCKPSLWRGCMGIISLAKPCSQNEVPPLTEDTNELPILVLSSGQFWWVSSAKTWIEKTQTGRRWGKQLFVSRRNWL
jgi:hypothetical protein